MRRKSSSVRFVAAVGSLAVAGCTGDFLNRTASLGGTTAGERGEVQVVLINNTPYRAVFSVGTYDQTNSFHVPDFSQFAHDADGLVLEGDTTSPIGSLDCARVFSIGGPRLLALLEANVDAANLIDDAMIEGVEFFSVADGEPIRQGTANAFEALIGVDFPCSALLIIRFETDAGGGFRVDFELIPSESSR